MSTSFLSKSQRYKEHISVYVHKPVFEKTAKIQRSYVPLRGNTTFVLLTTACTMTIIDKIMIFCNDVNKSTSSELLAINSPHYMS